MTCSLLGQYIVSNGASLWLKFCIFAIGFLEVNYSGTEKLVFVNSMLI